MGTNVSTNYVTCPADTQKTLGIKLPFLVMIIKNLKKYFTFEVQVLDDKNVRRRFRASSRSFARCPCAWTRAGTRSSSTSPTSLAALTAPTTLRRCVCRSTPTAASAASTSRTACTRRRSCRPSSSSSCPSRSSRQRSSRHAALLPRRLLAPARAALAVREEGLGHPTRGMIRGGVGRDGLQKCGKRLAGGARSR